MPRILATAFRSRKANSRRFDSRGARRTLYCALPGDETMGEASGGEIILFFVSLVLTLVL
jgi:hypothetical protein